MTRRTARWAVVVTALWGLGHVRAVAEEFSVRLRVFAGEKDLKGDWNLGRYDLDLSSQPELGLQVWFGAEGWPVEMSVEIFASTRSQEGYSGELEGRSQELIFGFRKGREHGRFRPFFGVGLCYTTGSIRGTLENLPIDFHDRALGGWASVGLAWRLPRRFELGLEARATNAEGGVQIGGLHLGFVAGYEWLLGRSRRLIRT
jgi:hypothetical protein